MNDHSPLSLRYGTNPHQTPASVTAHSGALPIEVLNGEPGYINLLDALNGWQLVRDLRESLGLPSAASFKHVSPAGAAVSVPLQPDVLRSYQLETNADLSALATAYARARGADHVVSFGDFVALSDRVDLSTAQLIRREVSDGVIAPAYDDDVLALLKKKKGGKYLVIRIDPDYRPSSEVESRDVFGITFEQRRNDVRLGAEHLANRVTRMRDIPDSAVGDLIVALTTIKYTQSNSICLAIDGQAIGVGAGQQSRVLCTRLASTKADTWRLRRHPAAIDLPFREELGRTERDNAIDGFLRDDLTEQEEAVWLQSFRMAPRRLTADERRAWLDAASGVSMASDGFIPFRDNIDRASRSGVKYVVQPGGSVRDQGVIDACDEYGIAMALSGLRLFHH